MDTVHIEWIRAYACQALSDIQARGRILEHPELPACHQLHYLQMACEKLCKASLCAGGSQVSDLQSSHAYIATNLPIVAREYLARAARKRSLGSWQVKAIAKLARDIELLAPSVRGGGAVPANVEYPWKGPDGSILTPALHNFGLGMLHEPAGRTLLKIIYQAASDLQRYGEAGQ